MLGFESEKIGWILREHCRFEVSHVVGCCDNDNNNRKNKIMEENKNLECVDMDAEEE